MSHLCTKTNILPRQARDKHRETSKTDLFQDGNDEISLSEFKLLVRSLRSSQSTLHQLQSTKRIRSMHKSFVGGLHAAEHDTMSFGGALRAVVVPWHIRNPESCFSVVWCGKSQRRRAFLCTVFSDG
jgi:hypothetical protein